MSSRLLAMMMSGVIVLGAATGCDEKAGSSRDAVADAPDAQVSADAGASESRKRPAGPVADLSEELHGGDGVFLGAADGSRLPDGYVEHEYVAAGTATAYQASGELGDDGRFSFEPGPTAEYRTRVLVRTPERSAAASGTIIVEWLNVSGGADANPEYASLEEEIVREGHTWVGVSAQMIGIEGGAVLVSTPGGEGIAGKGIKQIDPERYGSLVHPGDGFAYDVFSQVARALWQDEAALSGVVPKFMLAAGESQSAAALTTYFNGVQPLTHVFDGFLVHSRGAGALPLVEPGKYADLAGAITSGAHPILRDDLTVPVLELQTEGDLTGLLNSSAARQPDTEHFRLWEVAGTAHADAHLVGALADSLDCGAPINNGPMHIVAKAALHALDTWVRTGELPVGADRIELDEGARPMIRRNEDGIALGGIRTPPVDVPVAVLSGEPGPNPEIICALLGSAAPLSAARLSELYSDRDDYLKKYQSATDRAIESHFVLAAERAALLDFAEPSRIAP